MEVNEKKECSAFLRQVFLCRTFFFAAVSVGFVVFFSTAPMQTNKHAVAAERSIEGKDVCARCSHNTCIVPQVEKEKSLLLHNIPSIEVRGA